MIECLEGKYSERETVLSMNMNVASDEHVNVGEHALHSQRTKNVVMMSQLASTCCTHLLLTDKAAA